MLSYLGAAFVIFGMFIFLISATNPTGLGLFLALGVVVLGMGLVLSYLALKLRNGNDWEEIPEETSASCLPLTYLQSEVERNRVEEATSSGNRALGFVLISLGAFVLSTFVFYGFFLGWILLLLGVGFMISGVLLRYN